MRVDITWRGPQLKTRVSSSGGQALAKAGEALLSAAKDEVPVDEGILRGSGMVEPKGPERVAVSFNTPYAKRQHEEVSWNHPKGGKAKYLEDPLFQKAATWRALIQKELFSSFGRG